MATKSGFNVGISKNAKDFLDTVLKMIGKHNDAGDKSPLIHIENVDWTVAEVKAKEALRLHNEAEAAKKTSERLNAERDKLIEELKTPTVNSKNTLRGIHAANLRRLTDWGFDVTETPKTTPNGGKKKGKVIVN